MGALEAVDWLSIAPLITAGGVLIGAFLGAAGTLLTQRFVVRRNWEMAKVEHRLKVRDDRRDAVFEFLKAVQGANDVAESRFLTGNRDDGAARAAMRNVWFTQQCLDVVSSRALRPQTLRLAIRVNEAVWHPLPDDMTMWDYITEVRNPFLEAAKVELDTTKDIGLPPIEDGQAVPLGALRKVFAGKRVGRLHS